MLRLIQLAQNGVPPPQITKNEINHWWVQNRLCWFDWIDAACKIGHMETFVFCVKKPLERAKNGFNKFWFVENLENIFINQDRTSFKTAARPSEQKIWSNHKESVGPTIGHSVCPSVRLSVHPFVGRSELPQNVPIYPKMFINVHASLPSLFRRRHYSKKWFLILNAWKYLELNASFRPGSKERKKV